MEEQKDLLLVCIKCEEEGTVTEFESLGSLQNHLCATHLHWTPFQCPYCNANATSHQLLKGHINRIHQGQKHMVLYIPDEEISPRLDRLTIQSVARSITHSNSHRFSETTQDDAIPVERQTHGCESDTPSTSGGLRGSYLDSLSVGSPFSTSAAISKLVEEDVSQTISPEITLRTLAEETEGNKFLAGLADYELYGEPPTHSSNTMTWENTGKRSLARYQGDSLELAGSYSQHQEKKKKGDYFAEAWTWNETALFAETPAGVEEFALYEGNGKEFPMFPKSFVKALAAPIKANPRFLVNAICRLSWHLLRSRLCATDFFSGNLVSSVRKVNTLLEFFHQQSNVVAQAVIAALWEFSDMDTRSEEQNLEQATKAVKQMKSNIGTVKTRQKNNIYLTPS